MFATEWGKKKKKKDKFNQYNFKNIKKKSLLVWEEHCTECAAPLCYGKCDKYRKRKDGRCRLFENGISKTKCKGTIDNYSYTILFQGWSKLESLYRIKQHGKVYNRFFNVFSNFCFSVAKMFSNVFERKKKIWFLTDKMHSLRNHLFNFFNKFGNKPDVFFIAVDSKKDNVNLILEIRNTERFLYRKSFQLTKGYNQFIIDYDELKIDQKKPKDKNYIYIYPDQEVELKFYALDFVTLKKQELKRINEEFKIEVKPEQKKIKCVAWDLDNTLWNGVLIEGKVLLNQNIVHLIKELDSKGIVNSIVSKNDFNEAYNKIKEYHLDEYFVFPHINWIPKSVNIKDLAKRMNIGIDTIAFIDDSIFELNEVKENCPEVLCINTLNVNKIHQLDCFNVIVTEDSKKRRNTYRMMEQEQKELENWDGNIDDFLRSCHMKLILCEPKEEEIQRCYELLQRTNQLNSSGRRLSLEEVRNIIHNKKDYKTYVLKCRDKFGDYGIIGFSIIEKKESITITDFVISCRVANKKVEHTFIQSIYEEYSLLGYKSIYMNYKKTVKNGPIYKVVKDLNMKQVKIKDELETYEYNDSYASKIDIIEVENI